MTRARPRWLCVLAACAVLCAAPVLAVAVFATFASASVEAAAALALATIGLSPWVAVPLMRGHWDRDAFAVQGFFTAVLLLVYAAVAVLAVDEAREALATQAVHATPAGESARWALLAAGNVLLLALVVAALPVPVSRRLLVRVVGVLAVLGFGTAGAAAAVAGTDSCDRFRFDRAAWQRDPEAVAFGLERCHTLEGLTEAELRALLVEWPDEGDWRGSRHDALWLGDRLEVTFGADGRVRAADLHWPAPRPWMD